MPLAPPMAGAAGWYSAGGVPQGYQPGVPFPRPARSRARKALWIGVWAFGTVAVVMVSAVIGLVTGLNTSDGESAGNVASGVAGDPDAVTIGREEVRKLLDRRSKALKEKNLKTFLADVNSSDQGLVIAQTNLFKNIHKLSFSELRYDTVEQIGRTVDRFGRGVTISLDVAFVHCLNGFDRRGVYEWYRWTVVKESKNSGLKITGVTGAPAEAASESKTVYYPAPWDKWPDMQVKRTDHILLLTDRPQASQADKYAPTLEQAVRDNLAAWEAGGSPGTLATNLVVALVANKEELGTLYRLHQDPVWEAGFSMSMFAYRSSSLSSPDDGPLLETGGSRIAIDLSSSFFKPGETNGPREIFRHELAHSMASPMDGHNVPILNNDAWVSEGFAEYLANRGVPGPNMRLGSAREMINSNKFDNEIPVAWFANSDTERSFNYFLAHQVVRYAVQTYGESKTFALIAACYQNYSGYKTAFQNVLGVSFPEFEAKWAQFVRKQVR